MGRVLWRLFAVATDSGGECLMLQSVNWVGDLVVRVSRETAVLSVLLYRVLL
jgi:hypothetical protein